MAKMKTFAVEVEVTLTRTVFVDARRPDGAVDRLRTPEGWAEATRYSEDPVLDALSRLPDEGEDGRTRASVVRVRQA